jgi:hypothetical protein
MCSKVSAFKQFKYIEPLERRQVFFLRFSRISFFPSCAREMAVHILPRKSVYTRPDANLHLVGIQKKSQQFQHIKVTQSLYLLP